jgi:DNA-binding LacI/PurR family transcriptional regulator
VNRLNIAVEALRASAESGLVLAVDTAVVGGGDIMAAPLLSPTLTTLMVPEYGKGAGSARMLRERISGRSEVFLRPELIVSESVPQRHDLS